MMTFLRRLIGRLTTSFSHSGASSPALTWAGRKAPSDWETNVTPWAIMSVASRETPPDISKLSQPVDPQLPPDTDVSKLSISPRPTSAKPESSQQTGSVAVGDVSSTGGVDATPPMSAAARLSRSRVSGISLSSSRPAPPSPTPSRHPSLSLRSGSRSRPVSSVPSLASSAPSKSRFSVGLLTSSPIDLLNPSLSGVGGSTSGKRKSARKSLSSKLLTATVRSPPTILVRDFAYPKTDERHAGTLTSSPQDSSESRHSGFGASSSPRWSGFAARFGWGSRNNSGDRLSQSRLSSQYTGTPTSSDFLAATPTRQNNTLGAGVGGESPQADDDVSEEDDESEVCEDTLPAPQSEFLPGLYRAIFPFVAEGAAEMDLKEEQLVNVLGRGGGDGWVVVATEDGGQALVPESYLELVVPYSPMLEQAAPQRALHAPVDSGERRNNNERSTTPRA